MKKSISVTIEQELIDEIKDSFPHKNRSQVIEEALKFWTAQKRKNLIKEDAKKLIHFASESKQIERDTLEDGLHDL